MRVIKNTHICLCVLWLLGILSRAIRISRPIKSMAKSSLTTSLRMSVYSSNLGIPAALVEERDACGVGFIANLQNKASHSVVSQALASCTCMEHRGATSADNKSGDGAGIMTAIPWDLLLNDLPHLNSQLNLSNKDSLGAMAVGMLFLSRESSLAEKQINLVENILKKYNVNLVSWRDVPIDNGVLGRFSSEYVPTIKQIIVQANDKSYEIDSKEYEKLLYTISNEIQEASEIYVSSFSSKTIVYKGMLMSCDLPLFYKDLSNPLFTSTFAIYHRRFSTNTIPKWFLAQPMRLLAHNGEINTLLGNINWVKSREFSKSKSDKYLVDLGRSDSSNLDSVLDSYVKSGCTPEEALMILVPEAYSCRPKLRNRQEVLSFYKYYESMQEAWDGPALLVFSDGNVVGAALDRNGLRPARYMVTKDANTNEEFVHLMSEVGVTKALEQFSLNDMENSSVKSLHLVDSGRLGPGEMLMVDLEKHLLKHNDEIKLDVARRKPYQRLLEDTVVEQGRLSFLKDIEKFKSSYSLDTENLSKVLDVEPVAYNLKTDCIVETLTYFGWGVEDVEVQISEMASSGIEATASMGEDAPLSVLSKFPHPLYDYFKQRFAQVTNPPIDSLREGAVMSLNMFLGQRGHPMKHIDDVSKRIKIESPILNSNELEAIINQSDSLKKISTLYPIKDALTIGGLELQLNSLCTKVIEAVEQGIDIIHLSDHYQSFEPEVNSYEGLAFIPPLLAVAAVHHGLIDRGIRAQVSIIISTGQAWTTHHAACLVGYGASAVIPYAAYDAVLHWHGQKRIQLAIQRGDLSKTLTADKALENYRKALDKGVLKILSKMGISLLTSYQGAQIFESIGLSDNVLLKVFKGTPSRVGGLDLDDIALENAAFSIKAFPSGDELAGLGSEIEKNKKLFNYGFLNYFKSGEFHHNNQPLVKQLHQAIRSKDFDIFKLYEQSVKSRPPTTLRDTFEFSKARNSIPIEEVESVESIMVRFCTGGMSLGALSREAHETLAIGMNRIGGKSNSGEGGEDPMRREPILDVNEEGLSPSFPHLKGLQSGDVASSKIKQIASGRFGVTPAYLMNAEQLEIKIAQGAKPGEGGQLPGAKIDSYIASLRNSKPGVTLISPPPHHDIYSIEDLAQLIYDLHQINPEAGVSVKLVSEVGIGTIASGVAKAGADIIQISGHDGGTGASPISSLKHAGSPWELGLVEVHSTLIKNNLRDRVLLRVDGGLKSGWDVIMSAVMGAEEFGFGTIAMIAEGCIMARICHTNKCPVGVTTQNEALRKRFTGVPENIVTYFTYVAEEVRSILATLGYRSIEEVIGQADLLIPREDLDLTKTKNLDVSYIPQLLREVQHADRGWLRHGSVHSNGFTLDDSLLQDTMLQHAITTHGSYVRDVSICNTDRSAFTRVSGLLAKKYGDGGFEGQLSFRVRGAAGQSFAAFLSKGLSLHLNGYANDYVCKGMNAGTVSIAPPSVDRSRQLSPSIAGNTCLYGATGGNLFIQGRVGERFAVRNSGAIAVVEGLGDHGCEYMTGGVVLCLGDIGVNFGAGMTGGIAFILQDIWFHDSKEEVDLKDYLNMESVQTVSLSPEYSYAVSYLKQLIEKHVEQTNSARGQQILNDFQSAISKTTIVFPSSERDNPLLKVNVKEESSTLSMA